MQITDRPLYEFELDCIIKSLGDLREQSNYLKRLKEIKELTNEVANLVSNDICAKILELIQLEYERGFFEGEAYRAEKEKFLRNKNNYEEPTY